MELHHLDAVRVFLAHDRIGKPLCRKSFSDARCALENHILFRQQESLEDVVAVFIHKHIMQEIVCGIWIVCPFLFILILDSGIRAFSIKKALRLLHKIGIRRYIGQGFHRQLLRMLPQPFVSPSDGAGVTVVLAGGIIYILAFNNASSNDFFSTFFYEDDVAGFDVICKLPCGVNLVLIRACPSVDFPHLRSHFFLGAVLHEIAHVIPADSHNTLSIIVLPVDGAIASSIQPIPDGCVIDREGSIRGFLRDDALKHLLAEIHINIVVLGYLCAAPADAVRLVSGLLIVIGYVVMGGL